ncbi:MAG: SusD/RagB family nutrient-binding outer membrane lipoprotein [Bacteroidales bacterium]|nr:SusD/RagB family nutrient-binding outer membrane lipoprotein [Bacteroidales bacterium]
MNKINKYSILLIMLFMTIGVYADYGQVRTLKIYNSDGTTETLYISKIDSVTFKNSDSMLVDVPLIKWELQSALTDSKSSVVATSPFGYQTSNANSVDVFAGYTTVSRSDFQYGPALSNTYQWPNGYYGSACSMGPTSALYNAYTYAEVFGVPEYKAIAQIIYAQTALHAVNNAGCVPYEDARNLKVTRPLKYSSQEETYNLILDDLDEAIKTLKERKPDKESLIGVEGDAYDKGDAKYAFSEYRWEKWVQLANTIKLRIAMYLAKPNPTLARQVASEALFDEIGVLTEDFGPAYKEGITVHPYYQISSQKGGWGDSHMSASFENIMKRTGNPLIAKFFEKNYGAVACIVTGIKTKAEADYYGIRQGTKVGVRTTGAGYYNFSGISVSFKYERQLWVTKEEVIFLKAEAALRWGLGGDPKALYEEGIRSAFAKYGYSADVDSYLAQTKVVQQKKAGNFYDIHYVDIFNANNNIDGRLDICVAWDDTDSKETKLEKIITQKWMAIFPNGHEAWVDYRRTGYPRLFPSVQKWQGVPTFPVELQLRRIPHDESDENILLYDLPNIEAALSIFGQPGENSGGQRLYFEGDPAEYPYEFETGEDNPRLGWPIPKNF